MKIDLKEYLKNLRIQKKKRRQFISLMTAMSFVVSGGVFWQLRSIGTAMIDGNVHDLDETEPLVLSDDENFISSDIENQAEWESTLPCPLTDDVSENMVLIALSQLDYSESPDNYVIADDDVTKCGYTRYGAWYGNPYGEWNTMFTYFCMHYAGVDTNTVPYDSGCRAWTLELEKNGLLIPPDQASPSRGDVILFDTDDNGIADRSGIITDISEDSTALLSVVEGDIDGKVGISEYFLDDTKIIGFVSINNLPEVSGIPPDEEEQDINNTDEQTVSSVDIPEWSFRNISESGITVEAVADISAFPMNTIMEVTDISRDEAIEKAAEILGGETDSIDAVAVDISFHDAEGNEIEPAENETVRVKMILPDEQKLSGDEFSLIHLTDDNKAETVEDAEVSADGAEFETSSFSTYILTVNGAKEHQNLVLLNGETGMTSADNPYVIYSGETLEVAYQGDYYQNVKFWVEFNNSDEQTHLQIINYDPIRDSNTKTAVRRWTANYADGTNCCIHQTDPNEDIWIRVVQPKSYMMVDGERLPLPRALEKLHNEKLTDEKILYTEVNSKFKISVNGGAEHLIAKDYNQSKSEYDLADGFLHRGAPDYSDGNTTIEFTCLKAGATNIEVNGENIKVIIGRAAYMKLNDGRRLPLDDALTELNNKTNRRIYAYEGETLYFSVDGYRFHLFDITSGKGTVLSMPTNAGSSELYENGNTVVPITCLKETTANNPGVVKVGDESIAIYVQHPLYVKTAIMDRDIDRVNEWLRDIGVPKQSGYIANQYYDQGDGNYRLFPYYVYIGDEFEIYTTNDHGCLSDPNYTVEYLNVGVEPSGTWGKDTWFDRYTIYGTNNNAILYGIPTTGTETYAKRYRATAAGYARITLKDGNRDVRTMYVQVLPDTNTLLDHADIEISDGGIYTLTKVTRFANGNIEKKITQYEAYVNEINRSTLYKNAYDTCTFYKGSGDNIEVLDGVSGYERENYWKDENIQPGDPQYEYTSKYKKDSNGNYTYWSNIKYYADDVDHAVFDTNLMLIPDKIQTILYNADGEPISESEITDVEDKTPQYINNVKFTMDHQDVLDAFNKCPNHTGLDFTIMAYSAMVEFDLSKELTGGIVEDGQFTFEIVQKEVFPARIWNNKHTINKSDCKSITDAGLKYKAAYRVFYDADTKWGEGIDADAVLEELHSIAGFENLNSAGDVFNIANNDTSDAQNTVLNVLKKHLTTAAYISETDTQYTIDNDGFYLFTFESDPVQISTNDANGIVTFNTLHFEKSGRYNYIIREIVPDNVSGILYDKKEIDLVIDVNNVNKQLTADITSQLSNFSFINHTAYTLPVTGGNGTAIYVITGMAFITGAVLLLIRKRRKEGS